MTPEGPYPPMDDDHFHDECGVFGIFGSPDAAAHTALGLHALQHRGQEAAGIVVFNGEHFQSHRALGKVGDKFGKQAIIDRLKSKMAIGHVRYSTTGEALFRNIQPLFADFEFGGLSIAHNGNLTNSYVMRRQLIRQGAIFQSTSDTETIIHLVARNDYPKVIDRLIYALQQVTGAYSLVALTREKLIGVRDPRGVRPLSLGRLGDAYILASESCAFDIIGAQFVRDIDPGEMVIIDRKDGRIRLRTHKPFQSQAHRFCIFEYIYFARPDTRLEGRSVYEVRKEIGRELARECRAKGIVADMIVPVPDSGVPSALGFAEEARTPFELGIIRNHYVGRTFIEPSSNIRHLGVKLKHNANAEIIKGKKIILVDDSIVRGTTSQKIIEMVRQAGATEVHMCIASPPTTNPCFYGIDTPTRSELLAANYDIEDTATQIGADSLTHISLDGLYKACGEPGRDIETPAYCDACFTGDYPIPLVDHEDGGPPAQLSLLNEQGIF